MKPSPFEYHRPQTVEEANTLLAGLENAKLLAGGQSLIAMMNFRYLIVDHIIDLGKVAGLTGINVSNGRMRIGAMTRQRDLEFSTDVARYCPLMREALAHVGHRQTRNRGTIGGSLAHADPAAELPTVCAAHDAVIEVTGCRGIRKIPSKDFNTAFMTTAIEPDEIITAIEIPLWDRSHGCSFHEFARRRGDFAVVGVAAMMNIDDNRVVRQAAVTLCGVANGPVRLRTVEATLLGQPFNREIARAAAAEARAIEPISDIHASSDYRRHLAEVLSFRAMRDAAGRCGVQI